MTGRHAGRAGSAAVSRIRLFMPSAAALFLGAEVSLAAGNNPAVNQQAQPAAVARPLRSPAPLPEPDRSLPLAQQYCEAIRDKIAEARYSHQAAYLEKLANELERRTAQLDARTAEIKAWMAKRDAFSQQATSHLIGVFGSMRPGSAAEQLVKLNQTTAAAIVSKLGQREASAILNEMPPERAAKLVAIIAESAQKPGGEGVR